MDAMNILAHLKDRLSRLVRREDGSSIIELAIVFPILLMLFVGTAELGRLFYTYTTLAKATKVGARYLSIQRDATSTDPAKVAAVKLKAQSLVVCGYTDCTNQTPIVLGLTTAKVNVCDNFSVPCVPALPAGPPKYFRVEITSYSYYAGVFNLAAMTGKSNSTFYFALAPGTDMRYMP